MEPIPSNHNRSENFWYDTGQKHKPTNALGIKLKVKKKNIKLIQTSLHIHMTIITAGRADTHAHKIGWFWLVRS